MRRSQAVEAVLFDRDGTLLIDVPYNGDPAAVRPVPGARLGVDRLRRAGLPVGIVTNQSGLARGLYDARDAMLRRIAEEGTPPVLQQVAKRPPARKAISVRHF